MTDFSHLNAIESRLDRERQRLANARTVNDRIFRELQVAAAEKELAAEYAFLGIEPLTVEDMSDDDLLTALTV